MKAKKIKKNGYNLHLIKNKNFKTVLVKIFFWNEIKEDEITFRNVLFNNLLFSSENYKTTRELAIKKADLYGANVVYNTVRIGKCIFNEVAISIVDDKYTEPGVLENSIKFLFEILCRPNVTNNEFDHEGFRINKEIISSEIKRELENPSVFAIKKYKELLSEDLPYSYSMNGNLKVLKNINPKNLYEFYKTFFKNNNIDIVVIGDIDFDLVDKLVTDNFNIIGSNIKFDSIQLNYNKKFTEDIITSDFNQSKLVMGGNIKSLTDFEKKYVALIYNLILGNSPNSKLFQNVREKNSLAYSINSNFNRLDGIFLIYAGISRENYDITKKEILKQMNEMKKGNIKQEEIDTARTYILAVIEETEDYQNAIIDRYISNLYLGTDKKETMIKNFNLITKEDIVKLANKLEIDTILLVEEKYEKDTNK